MAVWDDERVRTGMERQLKRRRAMLDNGARHLGWKVGLSTPAAMAALGTDGGLIGFMTDRSLLKPDARLSVGRWTTPAFEPEIAVLLGSDLAAGADRATASRAVAAIAPAFEVVDLAGPRDDVVSILDGNIFHRRAMIGPWDEARAGLDLDGVLVDVVGDAVYAKRLDPTELGGDLIDVVRHVADVLAAFGLGAAAGDVLLTGSAIAPVPTHAGESVRASWSGLGALELRLAG